jgi:membrane protein required for colicin V production
MNVMYFSFVDLLVVGVVVVSAIFATYRGFVSETLSIVAWAAAAFAAIYFGPFVAPLFRGLVSSATFATILGYGAVFLVVLIPLSFVSYRFAEGVKNSPVGTLDRALGFAFGVVRGLVIIGIGYLIFSAVVPIPSQPAWVADARLLPVIQGSSEALLSLVPDRGPGRDSPVAAETAQVPPAMSPAILPKPRPAAKTAAQKSGHKAYGAADRRALDRLFEATGNGTSGKP